MESQKYPFRYKNLKFMRWGGLSPVIQKGYDSSMPKYHSPPARKGLYAMVYPLRDFSLLGSYHNVHVSKTIHGTCIYLIGCPLEDGSGNHEFLLTKNEFSELRKVAETSSDDVIEKKLREVLKVYEYMETITDEDFQLIMMNYHKNGKFLYAERHGVINEKFMKPRIFFHRGNLWHHLGDLGSIQKKGEWWYSDFDSYYSLFSERSDEILSANKWKLSSLIAYGYLFEVFIERIEKTVKGS